MSRYINLEIHHSAFSILPSSLTLFDPPDILTQHTPSFTLSNYTMKTFIILSVILAHGLLSNARKFS